MSVHISRRTFGILSAVGLAAASLNVSVANASMPEKTISITTASKGGSWFSVAAGYFQKFEKDNPGVTTQIQTGGGLTNVHKVQKGQSDVGMTFAFAGPLATKGSAPFESKYENITFLGTMFPGHFQIIVRKDAGIKNFEDLFDKKISVGKVGFGGELMFRQMLAVWNMDYDKIRAKGGVVNLIGTGPAIDLMRDGNLDAIISGGNPPSHPKFSEVAQTTDIDLLRISDADLNKIFAANPSFSEGYQPENPYKGVKGGFRDIGGYVILIGQKSLSNDAAYNIVKSYYENLPELKAQSNEFKYAVKADALKGNRGMPVHPGAQKYYDEVGIK